MREITVRQSFIIGCGIAALYLALGLFLTRGAAVLTPDTLHYGLVARSLVEGNGYTIPIIPFHPGFLPEIRHYPELHGLLEPFAFAPLFWAFGEGDALMRVPGLVYVAALAALVCLYAARWFGAAFGLVAVLLVLLRTDLGFWALAGSDDVGLALFAFAAAALFCEAERGERTTRYLAVGCLVSVATLQKLTGALLVPGLVLTLLLERRAPVRILRYASAIALPCMLAVAVYALRNYAVHGGMGFRFSALDWLSKVDESAYFAYYADAPSTLGALKSMGWTKVAGLIWQEVQEVSHVIAGRTVWPSMFLLALGPPALFLCRREHRRFATFGLIYTVTVFVAVCVLYHVEPRYFSGLVPLYAVAIAGATKHVAIRVARVMTPEAAKRARFLAISAGVVVAGAFAVRLARGAVEVRSMALVPHACTDALEFVSQGAKKTAVVMSPDPWHVAWRTGRRAVAVPTNGADAIATVAKHYGVTWALMGLSPSKANAAFVRMARGSGAGAVRVDPVFEGATCTVYRVDTGSERKKEP